MTRTALVVTVVHHPDDARIRYRQISSLLRSGWQVTYAAPYSDYGVPRPVGMPGLHPLDLPRASGRDRLTAIRAARALLKERASHYDVVVLHDPELLLATIGMNVSRVLWDVHEDTSAALQVRPWVPNPLRRPAGWAVRRVERWAEKRMPLLLAEHEYVERFRAEHPIVPNTTRVPQAPAPAATPGPEGVQRVVYLGTVTTERGAPELVDLAKGLREQTHGKVQLHIIGQAHGEAEGLLAAAQSNGDLVWHGFVPSDHALPMLDGALAGLSLLHNAANFRHSMPTKVIEYLARGVPAISTPLPVPADLLEKHGGGVVVPFNDAPATLQAVLALHTDVERARELGRQGHAIAAEEYDWDGLASRFIESLERIADQ